MSWVVVGIVLIEMVLYNVFNLSTQVWGRLMETNAVFYCVTQVFAGKSLLVNIYSQYGLYAWLLVPLFKIIGLSTVKFSVVMGILNAASYLFLYLGLKRIVKNDLVSLLVFLAMALWVYWGDRVNFDETPRFYYQYSPIRILFPSLAFYLVTLFQTAQGKIRQIILYLLAITGALAVFWNMDTGIVVYGGVTLFLLFTAVQTGEKAEIIKLGLKYIAIMVGALTIVVVLFFITTKIKSGQYPDFAAMANFQKFFYISGFFMLPMGFIQFWNFPVIIYLAGCIYAMFSCYRSKSTVAPVVFFVFVLGGGLFTYFQGRSYDKNITAVMIPAFLVLGIFIDQLIEKITEAWKNTNSINSLIWHEGTLLCIVPFIFIADSAFSMLSYLPRLHTYDVENAFGKDEKKEAILKQHTDLLTRNFHDRDTVLILSKDYESYYYALGNYYNPVDIAGSTEVFYKTEVYKVLDYIKNAHNPIVYEPMRPWVYNDTIAKTLAQYTTIKQELPDKGMLLLQPGGGSISNKLTKDEHTVYYTNYGEFEKYIGKRQKLSLPGTFEVEFIATLDAARMVKNNIIFTSVKEKPSYSGLVMTQLGDSLNNYIFTYGTGANFANGVNCKLSTTQENHIRIHVEKGTISLYNNDALCGTAQNTTPFTNNDADLIINGNFAGTVKEFKISAY